MRVRTAVPLLCTLLSPWLAPGGGGVQHRAANKLCESSAQVDTRAWKAMRDGVFSFRLPPGYVQQPDESIDSIVREWHSARGPVLRTDYGLYNQPFQRGPHSAMRDPIIECNPGDGTAGPQLVLYRTVDGARAVGLYWVVPGGRTRPFGTEGQLQREALWLEASSPHEAHLAELLAIARSVELRDP